MMSTTLLPYLHFDGQTAEAMRFYHSVLGGELVMQTFGEANMDNSPEVAERILHAQLTRDNLSIMASDSHPEHGPSISVGNNVNLSLIGSDEAGLTTAFNKLAEGGTVQMPLEKQFWGDIYGALTDRFGIAWMVNITSPVQE
jgi:PhnB protein